MNEKGGETVGKESEFRHFQHPYNILLQKPIQSRVNKVNDLK